VRQMTGHPRGPPVAACAFVEELRTPCHHAGCCRLSRRQRLSILISITRSRSRSALLLRSCALRLIPPSAATSLDLAQSRSSSHLSPRLLRVADLICGGGAQHCTSLYRTRLAHCGRHMAANGLAHMALPHMALLLCRTWLGAGKLWLPSAQVVSFPHHLDAMAISLHHLSAISAASNGSMQAPPLPCLPPLSRLPASSRTLPPNSSALGFTPKHLSLSMPVVDACRGLERLQHVHVRMYRRLSRCTCPRRRPRHRRLGDACSASGRREPLSTTHPCRAQPLPRQPCSGHQTHQHDTPPPPPPSPPEACAAAQTTHATSGWGRSAALRSGS